MDIFDVATVFAFIGPLLVVAAFARAWRASIRRTWRFIGLGALGLYGLMAACLAFALSGIGFHGNADASQPLLDDLTVYYLACMLCWALLGCLLLFGLRRMFGGRG